MSWKWNKLYVSEEKRDVNDNWENFIIWKRTEDNEYLVAFPVVFGPGELKRRLREYPGIETSFDALKEKGSHEMSEQEFLYLFQTLMANKDSISFKKVRSPHPNIMEKELNGKKYVIEFFGRDSGLVEFRQPENYKESENFVTVFYGHHRTLMNNELPSILVASTREGFELADYLLLNLFGFKKPLTTKIWERIRNAYSRNRS